MLPSEILQRKNKVLTNYFIGKMNNIQNNMRTEMLFNIDASACTKDRRIALIPAFFETLQGFSSSLTEYIYNGSYFGYLSSALKNPYRTNPYFLNKAGYPVDVVLDENNAYFSDGSGDRIMMSSGTPSATITDFLQFIKTNPLLVKDWF